MVVEASLQSRESPQRWVQLGLGLIAMMAISSPQYVWTLFLKPFQTTTGSGLAAIQFTFSLLIVLQTFFSPVQGWLIERFGARALVTTGAALSGLGWILAAWIDGLWGLYATYGLFCGIGTGIVYVGIVGLMVRWFPRARGLATGVVAAGYGFGAILTTFPIDVMIKTAGYRATLITFGALLGLVGVAASFFLRLPEPSEAPVTASNVGDHLACPEYSPAEMLRTPLFWMLFAMMTMMSTGGLMVISQFSAFARDFGVADVIVFGAAALPLALTIDRITNGLTRPFFGWLSDHIGRENTMALAFLLEALAIALLLGYRDNATALVLLSGLVFFGWGEIFSLFPSTLTDSFGTKNATTNYGFLYMAQGIGSVLGGPMAALLREQTGSWVPVFLLIVTMDVLTALLALFVLKPMRATLAQEKELVLTPLPG
ncbi:MAG: oxalate/formate MFS antiporter [Hyphomicrobiales bacterium]|nr:oxalate/formate MFS antiporter [Hyphomicrobiales bacterium]